MKKLVLSVFFLLATAGCVESPERVKYSYASEQAWDHCYDECPGSGCPCILGGSGYTWYVSPEVGE